MNELLLALIFFAVAFFYSSVGFGGGSSYLAILSLVLVEFYEIRTLALVLNVTVVSIGTIMFIRHRVFDWKKFWPFIAFSIPLAFVGAQLKLSQITFFLILGSSLILAAVFMVIQSFAQSKERDFGLTKRIGLGGSIGFLSGLAGIGGGIFLSPVLNLMGWANPRMVASLASVFILVNSIAGLGGLIVADSFSLDADLALPLLGAVVVGGSLGSYFTNQKFNLVIIRRLTALLVAYVGIRLVLLHGFGVHI